MIPNKMKSTLLYLAPLILCLSATASDRIWTTDLEKAKILSARTYRPILIQFTGSDWCGPCMAMKSKVLNQPEFIEYATKNFILVEIDIPRAGMPEEQLAANKKLMQEHQISGVPAFMLMNAEGQIVTGLNGGSNELVERLKELMVGYVGYDRAMERASRSATDRTVAQELILGWKSVPVEFREKYHSKLRERIREMDPRDELGLQAEEDAAKRAEEQYRSTMATLAPHSRNAEKLIPLIDEALAAAPCPRLKHEVLGMKGQIMLIEARNIEDLKAAKAVLEQWTASALPPAKPELMREMLDEQFADLEQLLKNVEEMRARN